MKIFLVHHADAVAAYVDAQRPLSSAGLAHAQALAARAKEAGCAPAAIWHSGKLRARQTAEAFYRTCSPFAEFRMMRGLLPDDPPMHARDLVAGDKRDIMLVGHMPNLQSMLQLLAPGAPAFPQHGIVALERDDGKDTWKELWRLQ